MSATGGSPAARPVICPFNAGGLIPQPASKAELHSHTTFSDGVLTPDELVAEALRVGLDVLAVTDHDIVEGVAPARAAAAGTGLELIPGVEFSASIDRREVHVLGLFVDDENEELVSSTLRSREFRRQRATDIVDRLNSLGVAVDFETVTEAAGAGSIGRPHIAQALVHHGASQDVDEAFQRFIGIGRPAFTPKPTLDVAEVIDVVHGAGGIAILAHPASSRVSNDRILKLMNLGLDGFEVDHPKHNASARRKLTRLAEETGLLPSAGSDFHGPGSGRTKLGSHAVPYEWLEAMRSAASMRRNKH